MSESAPLHVCLYHPVMAATLRPLLAEKLPDVRVTAVPHNDIDPPDLDSIDVLVCHLFPKGLLARMKRLRWLQLTSVGYEHVRGEIGPGVLVSHAGSIPARAVAEFVLMGMLAFARNTFTLFRQQEARVWARPGARLLHGSTMVLLGLGRVGKEVAARAHALGMHVVAVTRSGVTDVEHVARCVPADRLGEVATLADHLVVCVPGTGGTDGLVSRAVLEEVKPGCCVIDVSRPVVVDKDALVAALQSGRCSAALLDVHDQEPLPADHPLWREPGVFITPHCAFEQDHEIEAQVELLTDNVRRFQAGRPLRNLAAL